MNWKIYSKVVVTDNALMTQWFWRKPVLTGREESRVGFRTRQECEDDARKHGFLGNADPDYLPFGH